MAHHAFRSPVREGRTDSAKKILVVDDDTDSRQFLRTIFELNSYEADEAKDGREALQKIQSWRPDLVITDLDRPGESVFDFLRLVKDRRPSLPVVCVTYKWDYQKMCMAEGAFDFIKLPFDVEHLLALVSKALSVDVDDASD